MPLRPDEVAALTNLADSLTGARIADNLNDAYYEGQQRLEHIGIAVPPELRRFETVVNWPRTYVDSLADRINLKSLMLPGADTADAGLMEGWEANNLDSEFNLTVLDKFVYGRGFMCVGANEADADHPLITVESPREMVCTIDRRTRRVTEALKLYGDDEQGDPRNATLYRPNETIWLEKASSGANVGKWVEMDRDPHNLGRVPVVPFINRRRSGRWYGISQMADVISLTDAAARSLTNLQIAGETHAVPDKWAIGVSKGDFVDSEGNMLPVWEAYFTSLKATANPDARFGQFTASSLSNFHDTVNHYAGLVSGVTGLPMRYLGQNTANPPSADGIRADESRLVMSAGNQCRYLGDDLGDVFALYTRIRDGAWPDANRIKVDWHDPGTPTIAQREDALAKRRASGVLSREGYWDELGWSEARKARERRYLEQEALDPVTNAIVAEVNRGNGAAATVGP